ncbi:hypothetical protein QT987_00720 [Microcoleus sp. SVA1B4]
MPVPQRKNQFYCRVGILPAPNATDIKSGGIGINITHNQDTAVPFLYN